MTHEEIKSKLQDFMEGLATSSEKNEIQSHLTGCIECANELKELNELVFALQSVPELDPPANFTSQVMSRIHAQSPTVSLWDSVINWIPKLGYAYALGSIIMLGIGYYLCLLYQGTSWYSLSLTEKFTNSLLVLTQGFAQLCQWALALWITSSSLLKLVFPTLSTVWTIEIILILAGIMYWFVRKQKSNNLLFA